MERKMASPCWIRWPLGLRWRWSGCILWDVQDEQRRQLPALLERLDSTARRLVWHRYLREHPLTPHQVKHVMGLEVEEPERVERKALQVLREGGVTLPLSGRHGVCGGGSRELVVACQLKGLVSQRVEHSHRR